MTVTYDLVVIGAGIHGAGIAQAASARGWSVLVVDKGEPASGTSSKSSKLIHGGLRYLETLQLRLVYECLRERRLLLRNAPELVSLKKFYIPVYKTSRRSPLWIGLGLSLYALLGGLDKSARFTRIPKKEWTKLDGLNTENLQCVYRYYDGQTDDAALTRAVLESAETLGAHLVTRTAVEAVERQGEFYNVVLDGHKTVQARAVVNAAGPWVNAVAHLVSPKVTYIPVDLVQGAHIILDVPAPEGCFYLESPDDGRAVFALPWKGKTMVGTTETRRDDLLEQPQATEEEKAYLLRVYNRYFLQHSATEETIVSTTAGLRVLPQAKSSSVAAHTLPRDTQVVADGEGPVYLAVYGGKLTSYRATAEKVADKLVTYLPQKEKLADTAELTLEARGE